MVDGLGHKNHRHPGLISSAILIIVSIILLSYW